MGNILRFGTGWHSSIPNEFIQNPQEPPLSDGAFRLFIVLISYASPASPQPFPSWHRLRKNVACSRNSLAKRLKELESRGWISRDQCPGENGRFGHNLYTICPDDDDSAGKRKQFLPPSTISRDTVPRDTVPRYPVLCDTKSTTNQFSPDQKKTTTKRGRGGDGGNFAFSDHGAKSPGPPKSKRSEKEAGDAFLKAWTETHLSWFKTPYLAKPGEARKAEELMGTLQCSPKDLLAYVFRMWINTVDYDQVEEQGHDPLFYQIKGSRSLIFFLKYITEIANEQDQPVDVCLKALESEYKDLEAVIKIGRPK